MAAAQASPVADTILARAIIGSADLVNRPAPAFSLTDQHGRNVSLASLRGKVVLLTFLDDTCSTDCPVIAQEFRLAGHLLGADPDNGGLVVAAGGGQSVITAFRPSQYLTFTPLTRTTDGGQAWSSLGPLDAAPANVPDALTAAPRTARLLALLTDWALSPPLSLHGTALTSASFGPSGTAAVVLTGSRGAAITPGHTWQALPPGTATLAPGRAGTMQALAVHQAALTIWQASPGSTSWTKTQAIRVPIQYGSSG